MSEIQRFIRFNNEMQQDGNGDYVLYTDHIAALEAVNATVKPLEWNDAEIERAEGLFSEMKIAQQDQAKISHDRTKPDAVAKIELWFFRDMFESNRLALFSLFGFKAADIDTMGKQKMVFRNILSSIAKVEGK